eukprot:gnl/MRDRNA2_/MRDRNA2_108687_c0_seq1.p1 gnl/MRDRNA2_/MRDRNA2_108687_c0~~gnl/MRDRNA2_/MRDRNA2_108687_c0_seq1.p1  ORF type:complete len:439 (-),score=64.61 gnl/MRDRNA2_/MRDRNA2_108687_c0_seq1:172-1488(-)
MLPLKILTVANVLSHMWKPPVSSYRRQILPRTSGLPMQLPHRNKRCSSVQSAATAATDIAEGVVLTSAKEGIHQESWHWSKDSVTIEKSTLHGGKQEGVDVITVTNGKMKFRVSPTRGMSVLEVAYGDVRLGWDSPVKEIVHPQNINLHDRGGIAWLDGFNEWMVRCGFAFAGHPGQDTFTNELGGEETHDLTLHGKAGNIPASEVIVKVDQNRVTIQGRVDEVSMFGTNLQMWTEISTEIGSAEIQFHDVLQNNGAFNQEYGLIYHANFGPPLLMPGSRLSIATEKIVPFNSLSAEDIANQATYGEPQLGYIEHLYNIYPKADKGGLARAVLASPKQDRGVSIVWPKEDLPYVTQWKNTAHEKTGYVTGIEPGTQFARNRNYERSKGRVQKLAPGATRKFDLTFRMLSNEAEVKTALDAIDDAQGTTGPVVQSEPEE